MSLLQSILRQRADERLETGDEGLGAGGPLVTPSLSSLAPSLSDMLLEVYDAAYCAGAGLHCPIPHDAGMVALLSTLEARYRVEVLDVRDPPKTRDELPGWLLSLSQQADTIEGPAVEGWPV